MSSWKSDPSLVAWYRCEDITGLILQDERETYDMTLSGASLVSGGAFSDGISALVCSSDERNPATLVPSGDLLFNSTQGFGISIWVKVSNYPTNSANIISFRPASLRGIGLLVTGTNFTGLARDNSVVDTVQFAHSSTTSWKHLCLSGNGTKLYLYIDGVLRASDAIGSSTDAFVDFNLGGNRIISGTAENFDGIVDDVKIFKRFLTEADAKLLMHGRGAAW